MITARIRLQLAVFSVLTAIAAGLIAFHYVRVPALVGVGQVHASAMFDAGAGIYPQANVTYRGVTVGKVTAVELEPDAVRVSFRVEEDARVPADLRASIKSISAIGEQYVDLVPVDEPGEELLEDGSVIPLERTRVPTPIAEVLDDVNALIESVPAGDLNVALREADLAFSGLGPVLERLADDAAALVEEADSNYEATHDLLVDGESFLDDQIASANSIRSWASDLRSLSRELRSSDGEFRGVLESLPPAAREARLTVDQLARQLPPLIDSAQVLVDLAADYHDPLEQVLVYYPRVMMTNISTTVVHPDAQRMAFKAMANYPGGGCTYGWPEAGEPLGPRGPFDLSDMPSDPNAYCKLPQADPRVTRGARNLQCFEPEAPPGARAATIYQCRGDSGPTESGEMAGDDSIPELPTDLLALVGGQHTIPTTKETTWQALMLAPVGD